MKNAIHQISKILLLLMLFALLPLSLSSCQYKGQEIITIEYISIDYMGGVEDKQKIDFTTGNVYESYIIPGQEENSYDYRLAYSFNTDLADNIINEFYKAGVLDLKAHYKNNKSIVDGGGWNFIITYADGTTKVSSGSNAGPYNKFKKADEAFFLRTGYEFLGYCDDYLIEPPTIQMYFGAYPDKDRAKGNDLVYSDESYISASNYQWNKKRSENNYIKYISYFTFLESYEYTSYYRVSLDFNSPLLDYKKASVYSYTDNPNDKQSVKIKKEIDFLNGEWQRSINFDVELNKNYIILLEFKSGKAEYYFSTVALPEEERYKFIEMIDIVEYDKSTDNSIAYRTIFTSGRVVKDKEGPDVPYDHRWDKDYYIAYSYDNKLSDDILDAFNELGVFDFDRYTESNNESAALEWELIFTYSDGNSKTYKTDDPEIKLLLEKMDEAFFNIVGQYIFQWGYIK